MSYVTLDRPRDHIALVTLNRPERYNALSFESLRELHGVFDQLHDDLATRVIVVTGAGKGFCAGLDLKAAASGENGPWEAGLGRVQDGYQMQKAFGSLVVKMRDLPQPLIAAVNGPAAGGGFAIALACDVRLCTPSAKFNAAFIKLGLGAADMGTSFFLPKAVGYAMAAELLYTGRFVECEEARAIGLVSRVVDHDALLDTALGLAGDMVQAASPFGLRLTKEAFNLAQGGLSLEQAVHVENRNQALAFPTDDFAEGTGAWIEKRAPEYHDR